MNTCAKRIKGMLCWALLLFLAMPVTVSADMGPKPSVVVEFVGLEKEVYYVTLLSEQESTGPWSHGNDYYEYMGDEAVFEKFCGYEDEDGYYFLSYMQECSDGDTFEWTYYPPGKFKILLYFPEQDRFVNVDGTWDRYAFDSYFTVEVSGIEDVIVSENADGASIRTYASYDFSMEILSLIVRVICTIAVELLLALLFGYREKKSLVIIAAANLFTQITLNVLLNVINYQSGHYAFVFHYVWMEIVVLMIEAIVYRKHIGGMNPRTDKKYHPCWYAVTANVLSFVVGVGIAQAIPGMF